MKLGMVGLGRMGAGMTERLRGDGHEVMTYDPQVESTASSLEELAAQLEPPRVVWMMIPAGEITEQTTQQLLGILESGDVARRRRELELPRLAAPERRGCGEGRRLPRRRSLGRDLGPEGRLLPDGRRLGQRRRAPAARAGDARAARRLGHVGPSGAGHFVKMVHNGIEYGLMQAYAEGFELMNASQFDLDFEQISGIWRYGSVVRSWLIELLHEAIAEHGNDLADIAGYVEDSGEGRWTVEEAVESAVPLPVITAALYARFASRQDESFAAKIDAALREQFGGHAVKKKQ